jgi:DNA segregation ATPase FtsK/SpoIIIE, S-DNA-T family
MVAEATQRESTAGLEAVVVRGLREGAFWLLAMVAIVLLLALASFDPADRSFTYTGEPGRVANLIGPAGAYLADLLYMMFGGPALLFPMMIGFVGWLAFRARDEDDEQSARSRATIAWRSVGFVLALLSSCGLGALHFEPGPLPSGAGGVLGSLVGDSLAAALSLLGATLVLLAVWFAAVQLFSGVSWLTIMDRLGHWTHAGIAGLRARMFAARDQAAGREVREHRETALKQEQKKAATRVPPRIEAPAPPAFPSRRAEAARRPGTARAVVFARCARGDVAAR